MPNSYFQFKRFRVDQALSGMKVTTDASLFGAWVASEISRCEQKPKRILDIGTGTGLLALMIAQILRESQIDGIEVNKEAYCEAIVNFQKSPWNSQLTCIHTSIQDFRADTYDIILCNPPFFKGSPLGKVINKNEAVHSTLLPAEDLLNSVSRLLSENGTFFLLYPDHEMNKFITLAEKLELSTAQLVTVRNKEGASVFRKMAKFEFQPIKCNSSELIIRKKNRKYTDDFWALLKEYYLEYNNPSLL
ncbi:methyltransferase [Ekhidna sp.]|uniref:tRNA1(Val) (adenine(37)-N6)-methyltransferase n=1 Tax=Ekhidna sp. TaxID=2608089 RepID=UPI00329A52F9